MKFNAFALAFTAIGYASAQSVTWVSPTPGQTIVAGEPFTATVSLLSIITVMNRATYVLTLAMFADSATSVNVVAVSFGLRAPNDPGPTDIGQIPLGTVLQPNFAPGQHGGFFNSTTLTIPTDLVSITGLNQNYTLSLGEFFLLGAVETPETFIDSVTIFVSS